MHDAVRALQQLTDNTQVSTWVRTYAAAHIKRSHAKAVVWYLHEIVAARPLPELVVWTAFWAEAARLLKMLYTSASYRTNLQSQFQTALRTQVTAPYLTVVYDAFRDIEARTTLSRHNWARVVERNIQPVHVPLSKLLEILHKGLTSADWVDQALMLMLCLGTRCTELLHLNEFHINDIVMAPLVFPNAIRVTKLAKKRAQQHDECVRPVLFIAATEIIDRVAQVRRNLPRHALRQALTGAWHVSPQVNEKLQVRLRETMPLRSHDLRRLYGHLSHVHHGGECNLNLWLAHVLGHDTENMQASFRYSTMVVDHDVPWPTAEPAELAEPAEPAESAESVTEMTEAETAAALIESRRVVVPRVNRMMTSDERWVVAKQAIPMLEALDIPITQRNLNEHVGLSRPHWTAVVLDWYLTSLRSRQ